VVVAELYFGRDVPRRALVSEAEWAEFVASAVTPRFPDGFTVLDAAGAWRDPGSGTAMHEQTKILVVALPAAEVGLGKRLDEVAASYRTRFDQASVGIVTRTACAAF
jgi:hypothetical protein